MPRDSSGVYTLPVTWNPVVANTDITVDWANNTLNDIATALTESLSREGDGGMNVSLQFEDGTVSAPGIAWEDETNTGWYRFGSADTRFSLQNADLLRLYDNAGTKEFYVWADSAWQQVVDMSSNVICDPTGATSGDIPTWNGSAWVPGAPTTAIPDGTNDNDTILWNATTVSYDSGPIPQQIDDGTTTSAVLGWNGSDWVQRDALEAGADVGDGATVRGELTVTDDATINGNSVTGHINDTTIHFTEASIDHTAIQNVGTNTHAQIDLFIAGNAGPFLIDTVTNATKGSMVFSSIPQTYSKLVIEGYLRAPDFVADTAPVYMYFNAAPHTASHYSSQNNITDNGTPNDSEWADPRIVRATGSTAQANAYAIVRIEIPNYASTTMIKCAMGYVGNKVADEELGVGMRFMSHDSMVAAITDLTFNDSSANGLIGQLRLYG